MNQTQTIDNQQSQGFALVPLAVLKANISERAKVVYGLAAAYAKSNSTTIWLRHITLSDDLNCSITSIQRAIAELVKHGFLKKLDRKFQGRYPYFEFHKAWNQKLKEAEVQEKPPVSSDRPPQAYLHAKNKIDRPRQSPVNENVGHQRPCLVNRREQQENKKQQQTLVELSTATAKEMLLQGLTKRVVVDLISCFGVDACELQLKNLASQKMHIANKPGWLKRAIEQNYEVLIEGKSQAEIKANKEKEALRAQSFGKAKEAYSAQDYRSVMTLLKNFNDEKSVLLKLNASSRIKESREQERISSFESNLSDYKKVNLKEKARQWAKKRFGSLISGPMLEAAILGQYNKLVEMAATTGAAHA